MLDPVLLVAHILAALIWGGGTVVIGLFVIPPLAESRDAAGLARVLGRRYWAVMGAVGGLAALTGLALFADQVRRQRAYLGTAPGLFLALGGALGLGAMVVGSGVLKVRAARVAALAAGNSSEVERVAAWTGLVRAGRIASGHVMAAAAFMALATLL